MTNARFLKREVSTRSGIKICSKSQLVPFLKWAGGKRWLLPKYRQIFDISYTRYIEPFLGSGAVFFALSPAKALLSDSNSNLIETYAAIKANPKLVRRYLHKHQRLHSQSYYYAIRAQKPRSLYSRAARFIYLNRTCWNALYRVNLQGEFNVPKGSKDQVVLPTDDFRLTSLALATAELICSDFEESISRAGHGDFVFADPPYTVQHNYNGFVKYNERIFSWGDQIRLRDALAAARDRGAEVLVTNANHQSIKDLYDGCTEMSSVDRFSVISGKAKGRTKTSELVIRF